MEAIGFKYCMNNMLTELKLPVKNFVSDRHIQIRKIMREQYGQTCRPHITHYLDPWHVAKSKFYIDKTIRGL